MAKAIFEKLISDFCAASNLEPASKAVNGEWFMVNGVAFCFSYGNKDEEPGMAPNMAIYADFGPVPPSKAAEIYRVLLEANLYMHIDKGPVFSLSSKEKHAILAHRVPLAETTVEALRASLGKISESGKKWKETYFLDMKGIVPKANRGALFPSIRKFQSEEGE